MPAWSSCRRRWDWALPSTAERSSGFERRRTDDDPRGRSSRASRARTVWLRPVRSTLARPWTLVALAGLLALASCTNNPYPDVDRGHRVLYSSFIEPPKTLDPAVAYSTAEHVITGNVYDTLLEYHYLARPYRLIPGLATSVPMAQDLPDGRQAYRFQLRPGVLFHA